MLLAQNFCVGVDFGLGRLKNKDEQEWRVDLAHYPSATSKDTLNMCAMRFHVAPKVGVVFALTPEIRSYTWASVFLGTGKAEFEDVHPKLAVGPAIPIAVRGLNPADKYSLQSKFGFLLTEELAYCSNNVEPFAGLSIGMAKVAWNFTYNDSKKDFSKFQFVYGPTFGVRFKLDHFTVKVFGRVDFYKKPSAEIENVPPNVMWYNGFRQADHTLKVKSRPCTWTAGIGLEYMF